MILKDKFLTQLSPDICCKLQKRAYGPNKSLDNLLQLAQSFMVGNMRKRKKGKKRQRNSQKSSQWLWKLSLNSLRKMPRGTQVKRDGLAITVERRGASSGIAFMHLSSPRLHVRSAKDHTGIQTAPRGIGFTGRTLKTNRTVGARGSPHKLLS